MATQELSTLPPECFPDFLVKAVADTETIDLELTGGTLTANLILDGSASPCANRAVIVPGQGLYVAPPDVALELADSAFADPTNPTSAEAATAVAAAGPINQAGMIAYLVGEGTAQNPDYIWYIDCAGTATNIESPMALALAYEVGDAAFADPNYPLPGEVLTYATGAGIPLGNGATFYKVGNGTTQNPDYVWYIDYFGVVSELESPDTFLSEGHTSALLDTEIVCGGFYTFDVSLATISQSLPSTASIPNGCAIGFKTVGNAGTELVLLPNGADTIDGASTYDKLKDPNKTVFLTSNGAGKWYIMYDYDPLEISGVLCDLQDGGVAHPNLLLFGAGIPIVSGASVADLSYEIRDNDASGAILAQFNGAPGVAVSPSGYLVGGTYDAPELDMTGFCGDLWIGFRATDTGGRESQLCQMTLADFNLLTITFQVNGDGLVTPEVIIEPGGIAPTWDWGDGSPVEVGESMSHVYSGGLPAYYATVTVCPTDVISVNANGDRLQGAIGSMTDWTRLVQLQSLNLSDNSLGGAIPDELGFAPLNSLYLSNNNIGGTLPSALANIGEALQILYLDGNSITGGIPSSYAAFTNLLVFHAEDNGLEGVLDPAFSAWESLIYFDVSRNPVLGGSLPSSYAAWTQLQYFLAESCLFTGTLPSSYSAWTSLLGFHVSNNQLTGAIPSSYAAWTSLNSFGAANNDLSGSLDAAFSAWTQLTDFRVGGNFLTGVVPSSYGAWTSLTVFSAESNLLTTTLDPAFGAWSQITYFAISSNTLVSGPIPASYGAWTALQHFLAASTSGIDYSTAGVMSNWSNVVSVMVQGNAITSAQLDSLVPDLVAAGVPMSGTLRIDGQAPSAPLNAPACAAVTTLAGLSWTINYDTGGAC